MRDAWDPDQYHRYQRYRRKPFDDLLAGVDTCRAGLRVADLGCGTGELTRALHEHLEEARTIGVDRSAAMLEQARAHASERLTFVQADLVDWLQDTRHGAYDLIFSNAALHWVEDQPGLLARLVARLAPGGQLAVQVPANDHHPSHTTIVEVAAESPFVEALGGWSRRSPVLAPQDYAQALDALGLVELDVRLQVYPQHLARREDVVEWVRGTTLTPYQARLTPALFEALVARYRERLMAKLPAHTPFFYPYDRILWWARAPRD